MTPEEALVELERRTVNRRAYMKRRAQNMTPEQKAHLREQQRAYNQAVRDVYQWVKSRPDILAQYEAQRSGS